QVRGEGTLVGTFASHSSQTPRIPALAGTSSPSAGDWPQVVGGLMGTAFRFRSSATIGFVVLTVASVLVGCSDNGSSKNPVSLGVTPSPPPASTSMSGAFASSTTFGSVWLTIETGTLASPIPGRSAAAPVAVSGTITPGGLTGVALSGTYDPVTKQLVATG